MPNEQRQMGYMMMVISPIMIVWISLSSASALGLYWSVSAAFLIIQTHFANIYYSRVAKREVAPMLEAMNKDKNGDGNKAKNTQVVSKKAKKK
jgi:YidC/Oxa1 family membrane protein insertase